ncbi:unnamed protein product [Lampetra planeri]
MLQSSTEAHVIAQISEEGWPLCFTKKYIKLLELGNDDESAPQEPLEFSPKGKTLPTASPDSRPNARSSSGKEGEAISKGAFSRRSLHALSDVFGLRDASYDVSLHVLGAEEADVPDVPASTSEHNPKAHLRG